MLMKETTKDSLNWINGNWRETERIEKDMIEWKKNKC